jgi:hypothetical protein
MIMTAISCFQLCIVDTLSSSNFQISSTCTVHIVCHPLAKFHTRFNIWKGIFTCEMFQSHKLNYKKYLTCEINFDIWAINFTCGKVCETQISYVKAINFTYEMVFTHVKLQIPQFLNSLWIFCKGSTLGSCYISCPTCNEVKIAKRYFQTRASWLTAITLNPHDNPSVANKIITPRTAELDNIFKNIPEIQKSYTLKVMLHGAIFLETCNAILLLRDVKLPNTSLHCTPLMFSQHIENSSLISLINISQE